MATTIAFGDTCSCRDTTRRDDGRAISDNASMPIDTLLPPNATPLERALEDVVGVRIEGIPVPVATLWNPTTCPVALLPWLAWTLSVDAWVPTWTEAQQRQVIAASPVVHAHKGTPYALETAIGALGYPTKVGEWFNWSPVGNPYEFDVTVDVADEGITEALYEQMARLIDTSKNVRSHLKALTLKSVTRGTAYIGGAVTSGLSTHVYPYNPGRVIISGGLPVGGVVISGLETHILEAA
jgi:phage tail P2-like protein